MPRNNPISRIKDDRTEARKLDDPNADTCVLALSDKDGKASVRTLVLRDIRDNRFLVFMNQSSPKWRILTDGGSYELLLWYSSMQRQYRITGSTQVIDEAFVKGSWLRRPRGSKLLDLYYEHKGDQSSPIESRDALVSAIRELRESFDVDDIAAPDKVAGIELVADRIEMLDLNREDRIHDRRVYTLKNGEWTTQFIVP